VLGGLLAWKYNLPTLIEEKLDRREKYAVSPGSPTITEDKVTFDATGSSYSRRTFYKIEGNDLILNKTDGVNREMETWILTPETTATCTVDLITDNSGNVRRQSERYIQYRYEDMIRPLAEDVEWVKENAKVGQPMMVFGDLDTKEVKTIYLYKDTCP